jgi:hypothetical protein
MNRRRSLLILILLMAVALRLYGIRFESFHPDEKHVVNMAQKMVKGRTLEPTKMYYGTLTLYLQAGILALAQGWRTLRQLKGPLPLLDALTLARLLSVLASVVTVWLTALLARAGLREGGLPGKSGPMPAGPAGGAPAGVPSEEVGPPGVVPPRSGARPAEWIAALVLAVSFLSIQCAHYGTVDSLMTVLATASIVMTFRAYDEGRTRYFVVAGLLGGLAAATKYTGVLVTMPLAAIPFLTHRRPRPWRATIAGLLSSGLGFAIGMPYAFIQRRKLIHALKFESNHYRTGGETIFAMGPDTPRWNLEFLYYTALGPGLALMALLGLAWLLSRRSPENRPLPDVRRTLLLLIYPVLSFIFVSRYKARFDRNLLPLLPFLAVFAALFAEGAWRAIATRSRAAALAVVGAALTLSIAHPLMRDVVFGWQLGEPHTKRLVAEWKRTLPKGAARVAPHEQAQRDPLEKFQEKGFDYIIMSSHSYEPVAAHPDRYPYLAKNYRKLFSSCEIVATFRNPWFDSDFFAPHHLLNSATVNIYHGPTLLVLKVPKRDATAEQAAAVAAGMPEATAGAEMPAKARPVATAGAELPAAKARPVAVGATGSTNENGDEGEHEGPGGEEP